MTDDACSGILAEIEDGDTGLALSCPGHEVKRFQGRETDGVVESANRWLRSNDLEARIIDTTGAI